MDETQTITIICDYEDCRTPDVLALDTLQSARWIDITCKKRGEIQRISLKQDGSIAIHHIA
jgi:hypothetical protein